MSHEKVVPLKCEECSASFTTKVSLADHKKFLHSTVSKITCMFCKKQFKRKKDANFHYTNMHQIDRKDHYKNTWNSWEETERCQCNICDCHYKYKKDLSNTKRLITLPTIKKTTNLHWNLQINLNMTSVIIGIKTRRVCMSTLETFMRKVSVLLITLTPVTVRIQSSLETSSDKPN